MEVLGFLDNGKSIDWINSVGAKVINILSKGSEKHCRLQLKQTPEEHAENIHKEVIRAVDAGLDVNLYLEDWSNGMKNSPAYVFNLMDSIKNLPIKRFLLPDTLGILNPYDTLAFMHKMTTRYPSLHFDFHAHNDYDLATANVYAAIKGGAKGIHATINGLGNEPEMQHYQVRWP